jgi:hypothetical protein
MIKLGKSVKFPRDTKPAGFNVELKLDYNDALAVLRLIRLRRDDCRRVTPEWPTHELYHELEQELELLMTKVSNQMPTIAEANKLKA